jgi:ABC-type Fe3+ transport system permease subunit
MKLDGIGSLLVRFSAAAFVLRGVTGLVNLAVVYSKVHRAVETNVQLRQSFHDSVVNGIWSGVIALVCGVAFWLASKPLGKLLANGLDGTTPATPAV